MSRSARHIVVLVLALGRGTWAQPRIQLSLGAAQQRAEATAPEVTLALRQVEQAEATRVGAGLWMPANPILNVDGRSGGAAGLGYGAGLSLSFDSFGAPAARLREVAHRVTLAKTELDMARHDAYLAATAAYVKTVLARLAIEHVREGIALAERLVAAARERQRGGEGSALEVVSAETELATRRAELKAAEADETLEEMVLRELARLPHDGELVLVSAIDTPGPAADFEQNLRTAREQAPELKSTLARLSLLEASHERLGSEARPRLGAYALLDQSPQSAPFGVLGLTVELPVVQRNQGLKAQNLAEQSTERARAELIAAHVDLQLRHLGKAHAAARSALQMITESGVPLASERLRLVEEGWRAGRFDVFRVTTASNDLLRLKAARLEAVKRIWAARLLIEQLTGGWTEGQ